MLNELKQLHPTAQVAAIIMGFALVGWLGYWFILWMREASHVEPPKPKDPPK
jgi:hypothetical protein